MKNNKASAVMHVISLLIYSLVLISILDSSLMSIKRGNLTTSTRCTRMEMRTHVVCLRPCTHQCPSTCMCVRPSSNSKSESFQPRILVVWLCNDDLIYQQSSWSTNFNGNYYHLKMLKKFAYILQPIENEYWKKNCSTSLIQLLICP